MATRHLTFLSKALAFGIRLIWAMLVLTAVCILWLLLFLVFIPLVLLSSLLVSKKTTDPDEFGSPNRIGAAANGNDSDAHNFIFDRRRDISKLFGCNTRNVKYRWDIFSSKLDHVKSIYDTPVALDFGAGSLRDSFELARLGFCVIAVDLDRSLLESYYKSYDWSSVGCPPKLFTGSFQDLQTEARSSFHLAIAFDVIEHLQSPDDYCRSINSLLHDRGLLFTIVPNRRSIFERYFKHSLKRQRSLGIPLVPGVPHLQFKSPEEWKRFFEQCGFKILDHEMAIGFFVNDCWNGLLGLPLRVHVEPVLERLALALGKKFNAVAFEEAFSPHWLMKRVDLVDELFKSWFTGRFGWNLIVLQKHSTNLA